jgi:hypothetical protein
VWRRSTARMRGTRSRRSDLPPRATRLGPPSIAYHFSGFIVRDVTNRGGSRRAPLSSEGPMARMYVPMTVRFTIELHGALSEAARAEGRSINALTFALIEHGLKVRTRGSRAAPGRRPRR